MHAPSAPPANIRPLPSAAPPLTLSILLVCRSTGLWHISQVRAGEPAPCIRSANLRVASRMLTGGSCCGGASHASQKEPPQKVLPSPLQGGGRVDWCARREAS